MRKVHFNEGKKRPFQINKNGRWVSFSTEEKALAAIEADRAAMAIRHAEFLEDAKHRQAQSQAAAEGKFRGI